MTNTTLREARTRAGLTQDELAAKSGVDQTTISALECGRRSNPSHDTVTSLEAALKLRRGTLVFGEMAKAS